ncbi:MAG: hypothetical protein M3Q56_09700 [Bacteroidota bacterium]|nr:hypothetical protein [Bacteroidota bacterium]
MKILIIFIALCLQLTSCLKDQRQIDQVALKISDSIYIANQLQWESESDSLCKKLNTETLQITLDSLINQRKEEILKVHEAR